ncbi:MAG: hypothetical protein RLZZ444_684 [Pseudomonadota bacterium]
MGRRRAVKYFSAAVVLESRPKRGPRWRPGTPARSRPIRVATRQPRRSWWFTGGLWPNPSLPGVLPDYGRLPGRPHQAQVGHGGVPHPLDLRFGAAEAPGHPGAEILEATDCVFGSDSLSQ